jgi:hypothetical protein
MVQSPFAYHVSPNGKAGDWYWDVTSGGEVIARGLAPTEVRARADAIAAASSYIDWRSEQISALSFDAVLDRPRDGVSYSSASDAQTSWVLPDRAAS